LLNIVASNFQQKKLALGIGSRLEQRRIKLYKLKLQHFEYMYSAMFKLLYNVTLTCCTTLFFLIPGWGKEPQKWTGLQVIIEDIMHVGKGIKRK